MKYYYQTDGEANETLETSSIPENQIFKDTQNDTSNWQSMVNKINPSDIVYVNSIGEIANDEEDLTRKLKDCISKDIHLKLVDDRTIDPEIILSFIRFIKEKNKMKQYEKQMEGIRKALDDKRHGLREYGRPKKDLPDDFEENIIKITNKQLTHEEYRQQIGMKKSTYFAKVKELRKNKGL